MIVKKKVAIVDVQANSCSICPTDNCLSAKINQNLKTHKCRNSISDNEGLNAVCDPEKFLVRNVESETCNGTKG